LSGTSDGCRTFSTVRLPACRLPHSPPWLKPGFSAFVQANEVPQKNCGTRK
jgi:hypothetical protein